MLHSTPTSQEPAPSLSQPVCPDAKDSQEILELLKDAKSSASTEQLNPQPGTLIQLQVSHQTLKCLQPHVQMTTLTRLFLHH